MYRHQRCGGFKVTVSFISLKGVTCFREAVSAPRSRISQRRHFRSSSVQDLSVNGCTCSPWGICLERRRVSKTSIIFTHYVVRATTNSKNIDRIRSRSSSSPHTRGTATSASIKTSQTGGLDGPGAVINESVSSPFCISPNVTTLCVLS